MGFSAQVIGDEESQRVRECMCCAVDGWETGGEEIREENGSERRRNWKEEIRGE
jgi:hypothetical protein